MLGLKQGMTGPDGELPKCEAPSESGRSNRAIMLGVVLVVLLIGRTLEPDPSGTGTHTRLLMPPCVFKTVTGVPCPLCGMTTAFAHLSRGELLRAFEANPLGPPAFAGAVALALLLTLSFLPRMMFAAGVVEALQRADGARWVLAFFLIGWPVHIYLYLVMGA